MATRLVSGSTLLLVGVGSSLLRRGRDGRSPASPLASRRGRRAAEVLVQARQLAHERRHRRFVERLAVRVRKKSLLMPRSPRSRRRRASEPEEEVAVPARGQRSGSRWQRASCTCAPRTRSPRRRPSPRGSCHRRRGARRCPAGVRADRGLRRRGAPPPRRASARRRRSSRRLHSTGCPRRICQRSGAGRRAAGCARWRPATGRPGSSPRCARPGASSGTPGSASGGSPYSSRYFSASAGTFIVSSAASWLGMSSSLRISARDLAGRFVIVSRGSREHRARALGHDGFFPVEDKASPRERRPHDAPPLAASSSWRRSRRHMSSSVTARMDAASSRRRSRSARRSSALSVAGSARARGRRRDRVHGTENAGLPMGAVGQEIIHCLIPLAPGVQCAVSTAHHLQAMPPGTSERNGQARETRTSTQARIARDPSLRETATRSACRRRTCRASRTASTRARRRRRRSAHWPTCWRTTSTKKMQLAGRVPEDVEKLIKADPGHARDVAAPASRT